MSSYSDAILTGGIMSVVADKLTVEKFRAAYAECKPHYELLNGEAVQKAMPTDPHSRCYRFCSACC